MGEEEVGLCGTATGVGVGEVIASANEASFGGAVVVVGERGVDVAGRFGGLWSGVSGWRVKGKWDGEELLAGEER